MNNNKTEARSDKGLLTNPTKRIEVIIMTMEQEKNLRIVQSIIDVVMCVDPSHDVQEAVCDLMVIAQDKLRAVFEAQS